MLSIADTEGLPREESAFPGPLRDTLVGAILNGSKTSTSALVDVFADDEPFPVVGDRGVVIDSGGAPVRTSPGAECRLSDRGSTTGER
jgi:uncharacterized protein YhfF